MTYRILEAIQRDLVEDLLGFVDIAKVYKLRSKAWSDHIKGLTDLSLQLKDTEGNPVQFTPYEYIELAVPMLFASEQRLLSIIRSLKKNQDPKIIDLHDRLTLLEIEDFKRADRKGLFILAAKAAEENKIFK